MSTPDFSQAVVSPHAAVELARRALPWTQVQAALRQPAQVIQVRPGRVVLHHRYLEAERAYLLRVFVDVDVEPPVVVTAYRTSKIDKYWSAP